MEVNIDKDRTFESYDEAAWSKLLDGVWGAVTREIKAGGECQETICVFKDVYGRPVVDSSVISFMHGSQREVQRAVLAATLRRVQAWGYILFSEAWTVARSEDHVRQYKWGELRQEPDRREAIVVCLATRGGFKRVRAGFINRLGGQEEQGAADIEEWTHHDTAKGGRMVELFDHPGYSSDRLQQLFAEFERDRRR